MKRDVVNIFKGNAHWFLLLVSFGVQAGNRWHSQTGSFEIFIKGPSLEAGAWLGKLTRRL